MSQPSPTTGTICIVSDTATHTVLNERTHIKLHQTRAILVKRIYIRMLQFYARVVVQSSKLNNPKDGKQQSNSDRAVESLPLAKKQRV